jgi:hypothetical protein
MEGARATTAQPGWPRVRAESGDFVLFVFLVFFVLAFTQFPAQGAPARNPRTISGFLPRGVNP